MKTARRTPMYVTVGTRIYDWLNTRLGISTAIMPILEHPVPRNCDWWYVFGAATLTAFIFQIITGIALALSYVPAPQSAYASLQFITNDAVLGSLIRGIHYWGASAMVVLVTIHLAHEFLVGSYKFPRELNWLTGVILFFMTLLMAFTGQLLRWDQNAYWALVVAAEQVGRTPIIGDLLAQLVIAGQTIGGQTLTRFYAIHVFVIPGVMFGLIGAHLYLVLHIGISEPPKVGEPVNKETYYEHYHKVLENGVPFFPDAVWKDLVFALAVGVLVIILAIVVGPAQLGAVADPTNIQANPRPDWYFIWYFALFALMPPVIENVAIIAIPAIIVIAMLILPFAGNTGERAPSKRPFAVGIVIFAALSIAVLVHAGDAATWSPNFTPAPIPASITANLSPQAKQGVAVFDTMGCHNCHTIAGTGGQRGPDLTHISSRMSEEQLVSQIMNGGGAMPSFAGNMSPQQLNQVVSFLETLK